MNDVCGWATRCHSALIRAGVRDTSYCSRAMHHRDAHHVEALQHYLEGCAAMANRATAEQLRCLADEALDLLFSLARGAA